MQRIKEVIIIRAADPDGSMFQQKLALYGAVYGSDADSRVERFRAIMDALRGRRAEVIELAAPSHDILTFGDIAIYPDRRTVLKAGKEVRLNHGEFSMLLLLASAPGQVFSKDQLYDAAWHEEYRYGTTAVENIIWRLRKKLEPDPRNPIYIKTVIGMGYKMVVPENTDRQWK